jgi:hypothetical protein
MEQLLSAIKILNSSKSKNEEVRQADEYLKFLERSKDGWLLVIAVLETEGLEKEAYFLSAKILKTKLEYDFGQLTADDANALPMKLMSLL